MVAALAPEPALRDPGGVMRVSCPAPLFVLLLAGCATRPSAPPAVPVPPMVTLSPPAPVLEKPRVRPTRSRPSPPRPARRLTPRSDPAGAAQARAAGLAALARGDAAAAVASFRRAAARDPGDPLIRRDLARARTVASTRR